MSDPVKKERETETDAILDVNVKGSDGGLQVKEIRLYADEVDFIYILVGEVKARLMAEVFAAVDPNDFKMIVVKSGSGERIVMDDAKEVESYRDDLTDGSHLEFVLAENI